MRLLVTFLVAAALRSQHIVWAQCSPQCSCSSPDGSWSPMYRILTSPQPSENDIVPRPPPRCSCGCSPRRLPPRLPSPPPTNVQQPHGISTLSGVVMDSPVFQQVGPATVIQTPPAVYVPSIDVQAGNFHTCDTSSHIMTIPRRQDSTITFNSWETPSQPQFTATVDTPPTVTYSTAPNARPAEIFSSTSDESPSSTYSTNPQQMTCQPSQSNSLMSVPQPNIFPPSPPPSPQPSLPTSLQPSTPTLQRPMYFTQPAPLFASCPATLFYPAAPALTCPQPTFAYPATPSYTSVPAAPTTSQNVNLGTTSRTIYSTSANTTPTTYSMAPSQDVPCNAPQTVPSPVQSFTSPTFQNAPSNTVTFSTPEIQQTTPNSVTANPNTLSSNTNFQQTPSNTIFFHNSDSTGGTGTLLPETTGPTITTHDSPLTYTLLTTGGNNRAADANRDCSVPVPPVLV